MKSERWIHLCVDMQRMFEEETPWHARWMGKIADQVIEVAGRFPERTIFTRFVPPFSSEEMPGTWRRYYEKWPMMTSACIDPLLIDLIDPLRRLVPPARLLDKRTYSPWISGRLEKVLTHAEIGTIIVTGGETDVCVMATVLGAVDRGFKVILLKDGIYSSADETHDASLELLGNRFSVQLELATTEQWLAATR